VENKRMENFSISKKSALGKSPFISLPIRRLTVKEKYLEYTAKMIIVGKIDEGSIGTVPPFVSSDGMARELIFNNKMANKIQIGKDAHGEIPTENFIINANDWDYAIKNAKGNPGKINLIKSIPGSDNFLTIGANKVNGYYVVTHFETISKNSNELKNLLSKGDVIDKFGRTPSS
jgi:hypothetical protein